MECPRCDPKSALQVMDTDEGTTLDFCPTCSGIWFDKGEVEEYLNASLPPGTEQSLGTPLRCPRCTSALVEVTYTQVGMPTLDRCTDCGGIWFDQGEVAALKALTRNPLSRLDFVPRPDAPAKGTDMVPILKRPAQPPPKQEVKLDWFWITSSFIIIMGMLGLSAIVLGTWVASDTWIDKEPTIAPWITASISIVAAFGVGGVVVGWRSKGFTVLEPAIAAVPAALLCPLLLGSHFTTPGLLLAMVVGFSCAMFGAVLGERISP